MALINSWHFITNESEKSKTLGIIRIEGTVYGHHSFADGQRIITSALVLSRESTVYSASGTEYMLGAASAEQEAEAPGARKALLERLRKYEHLTNVLDIIDQKRAT